MLTNVSPTATILKDEVFGPVAPIVVVDDIERSMELFNGVVHGLVSYLYTADT
ncbi:MAG: Aldehyde dehydrogenase family, partial [Actinomycetota bacterium]